MGGQAKNIGRDPETYFEGFFPGGKRGEPIKRGGEVREKGGGLLLVKVKGGLEEGGVLEGFSKMDQLIVDSERGKSARGGGRRTKRVFGEKETTKGRKGS